MNARNHIDPEDLALYAMQLLTEPETNEISGHLSECSGCKEEVALLRGDLAVVALTAEQHAPPASSRQRLLTQVQREHKVVAIDRAEQLAEAGSPLEARLIFDENSTSLPSFATTPKVLPWISWMGWAVAAGLTIAATNLYRDRDDLRTEVARQAGQVATLSVEAAKGRALLGALTDQDAMRVTLNQAASKPVPQGHASYVPGKGSLIFTATNLNPLQAYKTYELWLIPADGQSPIPAGTFHPDARGTASLIMPEIPKGVVAKAFGITIEDEGGSLQPTLPIILSGA